MSLRIYTCNDHDARWPTLGVSIVIAHSEIEAQELLDSELLDRGFLPSWRMKHMRNHEYHDYTLVELNTTTSNVVVLRDGEE